ncbi:uncharacterized protein LOC102431760 isoform X2 [Myotis lucifugus]|nr:uncharacterized protein LOC102431760 isoform X2 [Myotis lucifugus]XP_023603731.1 uncharacterized protein LOC102431760 isoform X2 [Myotis lucifugus]
MASVISGINEKLFFSLPCCVKGSEVRRDAGAVGVRLDALSTSALPGAPAVCRAPTSPAPWAALSATCCLRVSRCSDFRSPSWHRLVRSTLYTGPSCPGCVRTPAPWLKSSRAGSLDTSGGGGKSQQLRWPDSSAVCNVKSALPGTCMSFRHPPWLAPGLEAGREGMTEQLCRETEAACSSPFCSCLKSTVTVWRHRFSLLLQPGPGSGLSPPGSQGAWNLLSPAVPAGRAGRGALLSFTRLGLPCLSPAPTTRPALGALSQQSRGPRPPSQVFAEHECLTAPTAAAAGPSPPRAEGSASGAF